MKPGILFFCLLTMHLTASAQLATSVETIEAQHKDCLRLKPDASACSKQYLTQLDSLLPVVVEQLKAQLFADEKTALIQDQVSWGKKKAEFFKI
ncbi:MAG TPA: hypothetical protein PLX60_12525, partial [Chitinophagales bacterium]|nr:hypothetical protein [Chitinophagales bacterium]